ncbi:MAG: FAD-dependent thymidylate synthase [Dehalococcoidia bacterium]
MQVYAVTGVSPEVQAYAMAKYSRSAQSLRQSIGELSQAQAEQFLSTFYFQYGHRSIADLAHVALAIEDISILAAIRVVDEPLWDGQERSTRYQDFRRSGFVTPDAVAASPSAAAYDEAATALFAAYHDLSRRLQVTLADEYPCPAEMDAAAHRRALRARAFDVARYLLPLATCTSVGQVTSARVLERQIGRLLADPLPEARAIGAALGDACRRPAYDPTRERITAAVAALNGDPAAGAVRAATPETAVAPTLVKYTTPTSFAADSYARLAPVAATLLGRTPVDRTCTVELGDPAPPEHEAVATLLYRADRAGHSYRQVQAAVDAMPAAQRTEVLDLAFAGRDRHDEWLRELQGGHTLAFDLLLDAGAFRDLHRHRRCVQVVQPFTAEHGYEDAEAIVRAGLDRAAAAALAGGAATALGSALAQGQDAARTLAQSFPEEAAYLLPLGARVRALFKMDLAQAAYVIELRTGVGGHFSYRRVAYQMYEALAARHPAFARYIRATNPAVEVDLLRR